MLKELRAEIKDILWGIFGLSVAGIIFVIGFTFQMFSPNFGEASLVCLLVIFPLIFQIYGTFGLAQGWFDGQKIIPERTINIMQWASAALGVAAIFDLVLRLLRRNEWMMQDTAPFVIDGIFIVIFAMWLFIVFAADNDTKIL